MREIGGYLELELPSLEEYHKDLVKLNSGRNSFEYLLKAKKVKKVFLPYYTCDVMLEPVKKLGINYEFYYIDKDFLPIFDYSKMKEYDYFVYTNYNDLCHKQIEIVINNSKNIILDCSQAFFYRNDKINNMFYSARKFFGVSDGAYLKTNTFLDDDLEFDTSYNDMAHLLGRHDFNAKEFYSYFKNVEIKISNKTLKKMSNLTERIMQSINYSMVAKIRRQNFQYLHKELSRVNELDIDFDFDFDYNSVPMSYPLLINKGDKLRKKLIEDNIYVSQFWSNTLKWVDDSKWEYYLSKQCLYLPIDQRYCLKDMGKIIGIVIEFTKKHARLN